MNRTTRTLFTAAAAIPLVGVGPAVATPPERGSFHDEFSFVEEDFCGAEGLDVLWEGTANGRFLANDRGRDGLWYFMEQVEVSATGTSLATGDTVRSELRLLTKDLKVTDNGYGTLTVLVMGTGPFTLYGSDGRAIARDPGQLRWEILIDHGGTPDDPSDDEFLEFLGVVKGSTGRTDDFCGAAVDALT